MAIYWKKPFWGKGSSPRRAGCLGTKPFHGLGKPDASLGELGSRKIQIGTKPPYLVSFYFFDQNIE